MLPGKPVALFARSGANQLAFAARLIFYKANAMPTSRQLITGTTPRQQQCCSYNPCTNVNAHVIPRFQKVEHSLPASKPYTKKMTKRKTPGHF
jgi:hypothetical protein